MPPKIRTTPDRKKIDKLPDPMDKAIRTKWNALGGEKGFLGKAVPSAATRDTGDGVGRYNRFEHGSIYWSSATGAHEMHGDILAVWNKEGSYESFGYPTCDVTGYPGGVNASYQDFGHGRIEYVQNTIRVISGPIHEKWKALGGQDGVLGDALAGAEDFKDGKGRGQLFAHGWVYWRADTGAYPVLSGRINTEWQARGGYSGNLGYPTNDAVTFAGGDAWQDFEHGRIMWVQNNARVISGAIYEKWKNLGAEKGSLGDAIMNEYVLPDGKGLYQRFAHGTIYWRADLKACVILDDAINTEWQALGGPAGTLGLPTSDETPLAGGGGTYQDFEHGRISCGANGKTRTVSGAIYDKWKALGGENGVLGGSITSPYAVHPDTPGVQQQKFKGGRITDFGNGLVSAAFSGGGAGGGASIPEIPYMLTLEEMRCKGQTKGEPGADELWLRTIVQTNGTLNENGEVSCIVDYHNDDVNTGEYFAPNLVLYGGRLPETFKLSYMAIQVNLDEDAQGAMNTFTEKVKETGQQWFTTGNSLFEFIIGWNMASNSLGGAICVASGNPWAQWIGGVAGIAVDALLVWVLSWYKTKLIGTNLSPYLGQVLLDESSGKLALPAGTGGTPAEVQIYGSSAKDKIIELVAVTYGQFDNGDIREDWEFSGTDESVDYVFTFRHFLGDGKGPAPAAPGDFTVDTDLHNSWNEQKGTSKFLNAVNNLSWKQAGGDVLGYEVERSINGEEFVKAATVRKSTAYTDTFVQNSGQEFRYRMRAYSKNGYSPYSNVVAVTLPVPAPPYGFSAAKTAMPGNVLQIHLYWMVGSLGDYGYVVERSRAGGAFAQVTVVSALVPSTRGANFIDTIGGVVPGERIEYRVRGYNDYGDGPYSEVYTVTA